MKRLGMCFVIAAALLLADSVAGAADRPEEKGDAKESGGQAQEPSKKGVSVKELLRQLRETRKAKGGRVSEQPHNPDRERAFQVYKALSVHLDAWNRGDIDAFMEGYWKSDDLRFASGGTVTKGWRATLERYKKRYDSREKMGTLKFSDLDVTVLGEDAALVFGRWKLERENDAPTGLFTLLFRKIDDNWAIVHDHTSSE